MRVHAQNIAVTSLHACLTELGYALRTHIVPYVKYLVDSLTQPTRERPLSQRHDDAAHQEQTEHCRGAQLAQGCERN